MDTGCLGGRPGKSHESSSHHLLWFGSVTVYMLGVCVHVCTYFYFFTLFPYLLSPSHTCTQMPFLLPLVSSHVLCVQLFTPSLSSSPDTGAVSGCRCVAGVQAAGSSHPQVDSVALQPLQGGVGLAHPAAGHLHRHPDSLLSRIPPQRSRGFSSKDRIIKVHLGFCLKVMFTLKMTLALNDKDQRMCKCSGSRLQTPPNSFTRLACVAAVAVQ